MTIHVAYRNNSILVEIQNLLNNQTKAAITDATVTATLYDLDGNSLGTTSVTHSSGGDYYGTITPSPAISESMEQGKLVVSIASPYTSQWDAVVDFRNRKM